jgi:ribonuclease-3
VFIRFFQKVKRLFLKKEELDVSLYRILGFYPKNIHLYEQALIHRSSSIETEKGKRTNNERLEFLGDAVLGAIVADIIFSQFPNRKEGFMTNTRSKIVQRESLNRIAIEMGLDKLVVLGVRINTHNSYIYGNAIEALVGAVYLDQGFQRCQAFVQKRIIDRHVPLDTIIRKEVNFKSILIEWSQKNKLEIVFELIETYKDKKGSPVFQSSVSLAGVQLSSGTGYTKKESQQSAAKKAIKRIRYSKDIRQLISELKSSENKIKEIDAPDLPEEE